nr:hypothetical protein RVX_1199 [Nitratidesulfovibrio sp. HK-II]
MGCGHGSVGFRVAERHGWRRAGARATGAASGYGKAHVMATRTPTPDIMAENAAQQGHPRIQTHPNAYGHLRAHANTYGRT